ncbi:MAG: hypothetical protein ABII18_08355 [bacterium]|nr:hypothetical protein [bacterium]MBU1918172.1 hypothetical protein [bacterium]
MGDNFKKYLPILLSVIFLTITIFAFTHNLQHEEEHQQEHRKGDCVFCKLYSITKSFQPEKTQTLTFVSCFLWQANIISDWAFQKNTLLNNITPRAPPF